MNTHDVLMYGHLWVQKHLDGLSENECLTPGVCGIWSVKDIVAHLASYEHVLVEVFQNCIRASETPTITALQSMDADAFNAEQVGRRSDLSFDEVLQEYNDVYEQAMRLLPQMNESDLRQPGTIPWYGEQYSIEDLVVYQYYGHKREHCAQIAVYRDTLSSGE